MKFEIVIGNPPYNNDIYLDFVLNGHRIAEKCSIWITPAKWQAKGGIKNDTFRESIVPYMSKLYYFPYCIDIFDIWESSGVCYYIVNKDKQESTEIKNSCSTQSAFESLETRKLTGDFTIINMCNSIVNKVSNTEKFIDSSYSKNGRYQVWMNNQSSGGGMYALSKGSLFVLEPAFLVDSHDDNDRLKITSVSKMLFSSNTKSEALSFLSWIDTKFIRFLVMARLCVMTGILNDYCWKFVPSPYSLNIIYDDKPLQNYTPDPETGEYDIVKQNGETARHCSLYVKYHLTDDEINKIESVIKARN